MEALKELNYVTFFSMKTFKMMELKSELGLGFSYWGLTKTLWVITMKTLTLIHLFSYIQNFNLWFKNWHFMWSGIELKIYKPLLSERKDIIIFRHLYFKIIDRTNENIPNNWIYFLINHLKYEKSECLSFSEKKSVVFALVLLKW